MTRRPPPALTGAVLVDSRDREGARPPSYARSAIAPRSHRELVSSKKIVPNEKRVTHRGLGERAKCERAENHRQVAPTSASLHLRGLPAPSSAGSRAMMKN